MTEHILEFAGKYKIVSQVRTKKIQLHDGIGLESDMLIVSVKANNESSDVHDKEKEIQDKQAIADFIEKITDKSHKNTPYIKVTKKSSSGKSARTYYTVSTTGQTKSQPVIALNPNDCVYLALMGAGIRSKVQQSKEKTDGIIIAHKLLKIHKGSIMVQSNTILNAIKQSMIDNILPPMMLTDHTIIQMVDTSMFNTLYASYDMSTHRALITLGYSVTLSDITQFSEPHRGLFFSFLVWMLNIVGFIISISINAVTQDPTCIKSMQDDAIRMLSLSISADASYYITKYENIITDLISKWTAVNDDVLVKIDRYGAKDNDPDIASMLSIEIPFHL